MANLIRFENMATLRSKWFSLRVPILPTHSEELEIIWKKLQIKWFISKKEFFEHRLVFYSNTSLRQSQLKQLIEILHANEVVFEKCTSNSKKDPKLISRYGMENKDLFKKNAYSDLKVELETEIAHSKLDELQIVLSSKDCSANIAKIFRSFCPGLSKYEPLVYLQSYPSLEIHRKTMMLEHYLGKIFNLQQKIDCAKHNSYVIVDPVTLYLPLIISVINGLDVKKTIEYRCVALYASLAKSALYCLDVGKSLRASHRVVRGVNYLEEEQWMTSQEDSKRIIEKRVLSESADTKKALLKLKMPSSPMWDLYQQIQQTVKDVFKHDNVNLNLTRHLPETETKTGSTYNIQLFLKMLNPDKGRSHSLERSPLKRSKPYSPPSTQKTTRQSPRKKSRREELSVVPSGIQKSKTQT